MGLPYLRSNTSMDRARLDRQSKINDSNEHLFPRDQKTDRHRLQSLGVCASSERKSGIETHSGCLLGPSSANIGRVAVNSSMTRTVSDRVNVKRWERWRSTAGPSVPGVLDTSMRVFSIVREWYSKLLAKGSQDL